MHIKVASVLGQGRKIEAQKPIIMKLIQKPRKFVWQHWEDGVVAQLSRAPVLDFLVIKGIEPSMLVPTTHQRVHNVTQYLWLNQHTNNSYNKIMRIIWIIKVCTLARSHMLSSIPMQGPSSSAEIATSQVMFQNQSWGKEPPVESFQSCTVILAQEQTRLLV